MKKLLAIMTLLLSFTIIAAEGDAAKAGVGETKGCGSSDPCGTCVNDSTTPPETAPPVIAPEDADKKPQTVQ